MMFKLKRTYLFLLLICLSIISIFVGVKSINFLNLDLNDIKIIFISRLPRLISIIIAASSISITGLIMQTITKNKFVSPSTAGTTDWARLGILVSMIFFSASNQIIKMIVAFLFCILGSFLFIKLISKIKIKNQVLIPLIGLMLGNIISAVATYFAYLYDLVQNMTSWLDGDFSLIIKGRYELLYIGIPFLILGYLYANQFTIAGMGKEFSQNLGLDYKKITNLGLVITSMIVSVVVVSVGSLPFLDLVVPNIMSIIKGDNLKNSLLDTALLGANFVLMCDILGRIIIFPYEIPIGMMITILGSIIFLWLILRRTKNA